MSINQTILIVAGVRDLAKDGVLGWAMQGDTVQTVVNRYTGATPRLSFPSNEQPVKNFFAKRRELKVLNELVAELVAEANDGFATVG